MGVRGELTGLSKKLDGLWGTVTDALDPLTKLAVVGYRLQRR